MKANLVTPQTELDEMKPGDYSFYNTNEGRLGIIYCCPGCGKPSAGTQKHSLDLENVSVKPSIVHYCGWHGWLTNGEFKEV